MIRARGITRFYSRWGKYSTSSFVHQSSLTTYMKPTVTNKCIHSGRTTIPAKNPIRRKALPNRRMDKTPLAHPLCARAKTPPPTLPPTLDNQTSNRTSLPRPDTPIPQRSLPHSLRAPELGLPRIPTDHVGSSHTDTYYVNKDTVLRTPPRTRRVGSDYAQTSEFDSVSASPCVGLESVDVSRLVLAYHDVVGSLLWLNPSLSSWVGVLVIPTVKLWDSPAYRCRLTCVLL